MTDLHADAVLSNSFRYTSGSLPLLLSMPHAGTELAEALDGRLTADALKLADTDWHLPQLYAFAAQLGAGSIVPRYSRYLIDLNRDPSGAVLYAGVSNTELCPTSTFAEQPVYLRGAEPSAEEIELRTEHYWKPYHRTVAAALDDLRAAHGYAILFEAHSIASQVPRFFDGKLPDFNFGTNSGATLPDALLERLVATVRRDGRWSAVANGRFKGGYLTRHYADPPSGLYSLQLELSQAAYMNEDGRYAWEPQRAAPVQPLLQTLLVTLLDGVAALHA
jgi:N-formylglutamate deformylase